MRVTDILGGYLYISGDDADGPRAVADVVSQHVVLDQTGELSFWYTMNGYGTGSLTLSRHEEPKSGANVTTLWSLSGHQSADWLNATVMLEPGNFTLVFSATVRIPVASNLAIDDIILSPENVKSK